MKIVISPSGNLYGSENVLFDYLVESKFIFDVIYAPSKTEFFYKLKRNNFNCVGYNNVWRLYVVMFFTILLKKVKSVYCNEGGHFRYIKILSYLFPNTNFVVHIRILEDTNNNRLNGFNINNVQIVTVSRLVHDKIFFHNKLVYDGFKFLNVFPFRQINYRIIKVGIVGRITETKGFEVFSKFILLNKHLNNVEFHFFGDIDVHLKKINIFIELEKYPNLFFHGFIADQNEIYNSIDIVVHFNSNEPLGRIFFESLDYGIPFVGINSGGIGEIAASINYPYVYDKDKFYDALLNIFKADVVIQNEILNYSRNRAIDIFSVRNYTSKIDYLLS